MKDKKTSLMIMSGEVSSEDSDWGVAEGVVATVWRISPI